MKPREYISWSQLSLWESDKTAYISRYFEDKLTKDTIFTAFGKETHEAIQSGEIDAPFVGNPEFELRGKVR
jgi:hypothetical protein